MRLRLNPQAIAIVLFVIAIISSVFAGTPAAKKEDSAVPIVHQAGTDGMRIEGEKRYHANCGRCHAAPQKFSPRMMATVLRHMRVRATVTAEDQKLILFYMTQ